MIWNAILEPFVFNVDKTKKKVSHYFDRRHELLIIS